MNEEQYDQRMHVKTTKRLQHFSLFNVTVNSETSRSPL